MNKDNWIWLLGGVILGLVIGYQAGYKKCEQNMFEALNRVMQEHVQRNNQLVR